MLVILRYFINERNKFCAIMEEKETELSEGDSDCLCGPRFCRSSVDSDENSSLDSVDEAEVVNVSLWESILRKTEAKNAPYKEWLEEKNAAELTVPRQDGPAEFLDKEIFPLLLPAMKKMLEQARKWDALEIQKCRFNGIDFLAEVLWNSNPRHPGRSRRWMDVFSIPPFRLFLRLNPRPIYPKSWLWTRDEGALMIQKWVRGWLVRKREDVQEMRLFWKAIIAETEQEAIDLRVTYSELVKNRKMQKISPCERYRSDRRQSKQVKTGKYS